MPDRVTLGEVVVGGTVLGVALTAEAALLLAHGRAWSLAANAVLAAVLVAAAAVLLLRRRPGLAVEPLQLAVLGVVAVVATLFATPGFPVGMAGWDPGVYTNHGLAIARTGAYDLEDPVLDRSPELYDGTGRSQSRFPGTSYSGRNDGRAVVGFYHLYPALLAPAADVAGERGVVNVNPVLGVLAALALTLLGWRALGPLAGAIAGLLAATNMIQVWHARYPTSEVLTELLVVAALLGVVVARDTRWRAAAGAAGLLAGLVFLSRGDGFIVLLLALAGLGLLALTGRWDGRAWWFAGGLALTIPHGLAQAYHFAELYTISQGLPRAPVLVGALVLLAAGSGAAAVLRRGTVGRWADAAVGWLRDPVVQRRVGIGIAAAFALVLAVNYLRPLWVTERPPEELLGEPQPYYAARALLRLTWYLTPVGVLALWVGVAVLATRRWAFTAWVAVLPSLAVLPVYLADARIGPRLIWWTRRFVPFAMPGILLLIAAGLAWAIASRRLPLRVAGGVAAAVVAGAFVAQSWPLRGHHELDRSFAVHRALVEPVGEGPAVWLWADGPTPPGALASANAFASTMLYRRGDPVSRLHLDDDPAAVVDQYREAFPDLPVYVVVDGHELPAGLGDIDVDLEPVVDVEVGMPLWEITYDRRPSRAYELRAVLSLWRVAGT